MKRLILLILGTFCFLNTNAERITRDQALVLAQDFMQGKVMEPVQTGALRAPARGQQFDESYYIFNAADGEGYVIMAADDRISPVLGFSEQGNINPDDMPENMVSWLEYYKHEINSLNHDAGIAPYTPVPRDEVKPLINNYWHQQDPYNRLCPVYDGTRCPVGCTALAMAQIMYYYKWPVGEVDSMPPYINKYNSMSVEGLPSTTFKWDLIKPANSSYESYESVYAVAELMRYCGQAVKMGYLSYSSFASTNSVTEVLIEHFNYSRQIEMLYKHNYSSQDWDQIIYNELASGRPVYYSGLRMPDGGHSFVCDGYKDGFFHINWGQRCLSDGYFRLSLLSMEATNLYDQYNYAYLQEAIIGIEPRIDDLTGTTFTDDFFNYTILSDTSVEIQAIEDKDYNGIDTLWIPDHIDYEGNRYSVIRLGNSFNHDYDIKKVYLPSSLKQIDPQASFLQTLREFAIPASIELLSTEAFSLNDLLERFIVQEGSLNYKAIDGVLFSHDGKEIICYPLGKRDTCYTVPDGVSIIQSCSFAGNSHLSEVILPDCVEQINDFAFYQSQIKRINLPESLKSIGFEAFMSCHNLSEVIMPQKTGTICDFSFYDCTSLKSIIIPNSLNYCLTSDAFGNCYSLESVYIQTGIQHIKSNCFEGCTALKEIIIESLIPPVIESVSVFDESVYERAVLKVPAGGIDLYRNSDIWSGFKHIETIPTYTVNGLNYILNESAKTAVVCPGKEPYSGDVVIPATVEYNGVNYSVKAIQPATFARSMDLTSVVIDAPVTVLPDSLFKDCNSLKSVILNDHIEIIGKYLFNGCSALETVDIPLGVISIGEALFAQCESLRTITIPESVRYLGNYAFWGCINLDSVTITGNLAGIETELFANCVKLSYVSLPDNISYIGYYAFNCCYNLQTITIPENVTNIYNDAFSGCISLTSIVLPDSLRYIGSAAFNACQALKSIKLPDGITFIDDNAFLRCVSLDSIVIPQGVDKIQNGTFDRCSNLKSVILPENITELDTYAFIECNSLLSITIPANVRRIGTSAFEDCQSMTSFYCRVEDPGQISLGENAFNRINENCILYVPKQCLQAYRADGRWTAFSDIRAIDATAVEPATHQSAVPVQFYNLSGSKQPGMQQGINIIRYSDGTVRKVTQ